MRISTFQSTVCVLLATSLAALGQGTAFTYQGVLQNNGIPANGPTDLTFTLYNDADSGTVLGTSNVLLNLSLTNGLVNTSLDFGTGVFTGGPVYLQIGARPSGINSEYTALLPRQPITASPYAIFSGGATTAAAVSGPVAGNQIIGTLPVGALPGIVVTNGASGVSFSGTFNGVLSGNGVGIKGIDLAAVSDGDIHHQDSFSPPITSKGVGNVPAGLVASDFNGDGTVSLASANYNDSTIQLFFRSVPGTFTNGPVVQVGKWPSMIITADIFAGGGRGLITANAGDDSLSVILSAPGFKPIVTSTVRVGKNPNGIVATDIDQDGYQDVVSANAGSGTLTVCLNDKTGNLVPLTDLNVGGYPQSVAAADLNGDGWPDLISADNAGATVTVLINHQGKFPTTTTFPVGNAPRTVIAADLNGDGLPDLVTANYNDTSLSVLINTGGGNFVSGPTLPTGAHPFSVVAAPLFGSGTLALVSGNADGTVTLYSNDGLGHFSHAGSPKAARSIQPLVVADFNGDGQLDLAVGDVAKPSVAVLLHQSSIRFDQPIGIGTTNPEDQFQIGSFYTPADQYIDIQTEGGNLFNAGIKLRHYNDTLGFNIEDNERPGINGLSFVRYPAASGNPTVAFFIDRFSGNVGIGNHNPSTTLDVTGEITCTAVNLTSDRNAKQGFEPVNSREVLEKVTQLPITRWQYKTQADARHIGPMAQDFYAAFGLGRDERHITSIDEDGVALAAIQGLNEKLEERTSELSRLKSENASLSSRLSALEKLIGAGNSAGAGNK